MIQIPKSYMYSNWGLDSLMRIHFCIFNYKSFFQIQKFDGVQYIVEYTKLKVGLCLHRSIDEFVEPTFNVNASFFIVCNQLHKVVSKNVLHHFFFQHRQDNKNKYKVPIANFAHFYYHHMLCIMYLII